MDIAQMVLGFVQQYPWIATILLVMGGMRVLFKPVFSVFHAYVEFTPSPRDNLILDNVEKSAYYKAVVWVLDFVGSIKIK